MPNNLNFLHDVRNAIQSGFTVPGETVSVSGSALNGVFNYIGTNRGTTSYTNPVWQQISAASSTAFSTGVGNSIFARTDVSSPTVLAWTNQNLADSAFAAPAIGLNQGILYDFASGLNAGSTVAGQSLSNQCIVRPTSFNAYWFGSVGGNTERLQIHGSKDGVTWDLLLSFIDGPRTWNTGWNRYAMNTTSFYRFIRLKGDNTSTTDFIFYGGSTGFMEWEFGGDIQFLETSNVN